MLWVVERLFPFVWHTCVLAVQSFVGDTVLSQKSLLDGSVVVRDTWELVRFLWRVQRDHRCCWQAVSVALLLHTWVQSVKLKRGKLFVLELEKRSRCLTESHQFEESRKP
jgi:hypothetical protein